MYLLNIIHISCANITFRSQAWSHVILPSYFKRRQPSIEKHKKRTKLTQVCDRDIICLPKATSTSEKLAYPRGKFRSKLWQQGLIGKIRISTDMSVEDVEDEVRSVFCGPMSGRKIFLFLYLQPTGGGSRTLGIPSVSSTFSWNAQSVADWAIVSSRYTSWPLMN